MGPGRSGATAPPASALIHLKSSSGIEQLTLFLERDGPQKIFKKSAPTSVFDFLKCNYGWVDFDLDSSEGVPRKDSPNKKDSHG
jgi:hypothetical protein